MQIILLPLLLLVLASLPSSLISTFIHIKKMNSIVGSISHSSIGGVGFAIFLNYYFETKIPPFIATIFSALIFALLIFFISKNSKAFSIEAIWPIGFSLGLLFMAKTPVYSNLESYIFGYSILLISKSNLILMFVLVFLVSIFSILFYYRIVFSAFDLEFLIFKKINTNLTQLFLLILSSITIVILVFFIGIILTLTLFTLPYLISNLFFDRLKTIIISSFIIMAVLNSLGMLISYQLDLAPSIVISLLISIFYILAFIFKAVSKI